jgi:hypothetical protein
MFTIACTHALVGAFALLRLAIFDGTPAAADSASRAARRGEETPGKLSKQTANLQATRSPPDGLDVASLPLQQSQRI